MDHRSFNRPWRDDNEKKPSSYSRQRLRVPSVMDSDASQSVSDLKDEGVGDGQLLREIDVKRVPSDGSHNGSLKRTQSERFDSKIPPKSELKPSASFRKSRKSSEEKVKSGRRESSSSPKRPPNRADERALNKKKSERHLRGSGTGRSSKKRSSDEKAMGSGRSPRRTNSDDRRSQRSSDSESRPKHSSSVRVGASAYTLSDDDANGSRSTASASLDFEQQREESMLQARDSDLSTAAKTLRSMNISISSQRPTADSVSERASAGETSRELRTRRLLEQQRERRNAKASQEDKSSPGRVEAELDSQHFSAHAPSVEKYLSRKNMIEGIQARSELSQSTRSMTDTSRSSVGSSDNNSAKTRPSPRDFLMSARSSRKLSAGTTKPILPKAPSSGNGSPANIVKIEPKPADETSKTHDSAVSGWSTFNARLRRAVSPVKDKPAASSKVDQYLASRLVQKHPRLQEQEQNQFIRVPSFDTDAFMDEVQQESSKSSEESEELELEEFLVSSDDDDSDDVWSVRVCVVSAVDLPASVVPNLPLSPVLKIGLVPLTATDGSASALRVVSNKVESDGLLSLPRAKVRCTSPRVLSQRDKGATEFHEEMRWDRIRQPRLRALAVELASRAVLTPANTKESPKYEDKTQQTDKVDATCTGQSPRFGSMFRKKSKKGTKTELEQANAAAALAKILVEDDKPNLQALSGTERVSAEAKPSTTRSLASNQSECNVSLERRHRKRQRARMTDDLRLGSRIIPLELLDIAQAKEFGSVRLEQWFELDDTATVSGESGRQNSLSRRNPSILLEITFAREQVLDDSEDEVDQEDEVASPSMNISYSKRASIMVKNQLKRETPPVHTEKNVIDDPVLAPGIIDFACVVGARDIGDQKADDGARGWVNTQPECVILERFPENDSFHQERGRKVTLAEKVEWFCFPEGVRLWRGTTPPNAEEMNLKRFSASSPSSLSSSTALFDAYLGCTTSFSWFVIGSNSDEYGSELVKTYGAVIRFYVPAPVGIDPTQDDFAQFLTETEAAKLDLTNRKRLWVPMAICLTSNLPIVGIMEALLLRLCDAMSVCGIPTSIHSSSVLRELNNIIVNYQKPVQGVVNCSIPFCSGAPLVISLPPRQSLPSLPHGNSISSVCRLLGPDGINYLLAALLTDSKILMHSDDVANLCLVAEVMTALIYPFQWSLPYVPVLPAAMMEFIEAPMPYLLGIPTCNLKYVDPCALEDVIVVDLNRDQSDVFDDGHSDNAKSRFPTPLPASVAANIARAVQSLLLAEEEVEEAMGDKRMSGEQTFPRLEAESRIEREFRLKVALELCGLTRGLEDCLVYASSSQPVFNVDKFLQTTPVMFEEQRGRGSKLQFRGDSSQKVISPRSRKFMTAFVNCQHFHQFLEVLNEDHMALFHDISQALKKGTAHKTTGKQLLGDHDFDLSDLMKTLNKFDDHIPTFHVRREEQESLSERDQEATSSRRFPLNLLQQMVQNGEVSTVQKQGCDLSDHGIKQVSVEYLVELEKNPWRYQPFMKIDLNSPDVTQNFIIAEKIKLRDAIGERRYRAWQLSKEDDEFRMISDDGGALDGSDALDLSSLLQSVDSATSSQAGLSEEERRKQAIEDAKSRDIIRRCLQESRVSGGSAKHSNETGEDGIFEAEQALQNASARHFLLSILGKRKDTEGQKMDRGTKRRNSVFNASSLSSKLEIEAFKVLVRLGCAILDLSIDKKDFETAAALLKLTAGLYTTVTSEKNNETSEVYLTARIGLHPVYAQLGVWEAVKKSHLKVRQETFSENKSESDEEDDVQKNEYEASLSTLYEMVAYGIPSEELAKFAAWTCRKMQWFNSEKGQSLLMVSKRLCVRREQGENMSSSAVLSDIEALGLSRMRLEAATEDSEMFWVETGWCHPAAKSARRAGVAESASSKRQGTQNILNMLDEHQSSRRNEKRMKRSAIIAMANLGSSVVVTGGLDGGVFLARKTRENTESQNSDDSDGWDSCGVKGLHLDWGSSGSRFTSVGSASTGSDGEYGVGSVSCLAATHGSYPPILASDESRAKDTCEPLEEEDLLETMDGCRVVAGTTCGDLRVWSIRDVFSAVFFAKGGDLSVSSRYGKGSEITAGSSLTRLKFSLRGRALSGHRGGVSCVDVPSSWYRPDSIISGGADGLIKLWSLRAPSITGIGHRGPEGDSNNFLNSATVTNTPIASKAARSGDALSILSGHGGRILCVKTSWHGDRMISCGADRTVRVWDLSGSGGRCLNTFSGHFGWVTKVDYWGPNTIISASTDRSIALWDTRLRSSPLFALRHHQAPVSDVLVGSRTDPWLVTSGLDGTVAAWDFRQLSTGSHSKPFGVSNTATPVYRSQVVRSPASKFSLRDHERYSHVPGPVLLSMGARCRSGKSVYFVGADATMREMDLASGDILSSHVTGHCDSISSFCSLEQGCVVDPVLDSFGRGKATSTITASWDGTVRFRRLKHKS